MACLFHLPMRLRVWLGFGFPALMASNEVLVNCLERFRWHRDELLACVPTGMSDLVCSQGKETHPCRINIHVRQRVILNRIMLPQLSVERKASAQFITNLSRGKRFMSYS